MRERDVKKLERLEKVQNIIDIIGEVIGIGMIVAIIVFGVMVFVT